MGDLATFISKIFSVWDTPITMPWIGSTSLLKITIFLALLSMLTSFVANFLGGKSSD